MANIELITGPAGVGKTTHCLARFREAVTAGRTAGRFGDVLWIVPTGRFRRQLLGRILNRDLHVCFNPQILTFEQFAETLLLSAPLVVRPLGSLTRRKLVRDVINTLAARHQLPYFASVQHTAGFLSLCLNFISELKREEIWPEDFAAASEIDSQDTRRLPAGKAKLRDLWRIYDAYQRRLHAASDQPADAVEPQRHQTAGLYDAEGQFWSARTLMKQGHRGPFRHLSLVLIDGFIDFTHTQHEMIGELAAWCDNLVLTLPSDLESGGRDDLFTKPGQTLEKLKDLLAEAHSVVERPFAAVHSAVPPAFRQLSAQLFRNPREIERAGDGSGIKVLRCVRTAGELEALAREVKRLLTAGEPADSIVLTFRNLTEIAERLRDVFTAAGIPFDCEERPLVQQTGAVRIARALLDLEQNDWPFAELANVLQCPLFQPDWLPTEQFDAANAIRALRVLNLDRDRATILAAVRRQAERTTRQHSDDPAGNELLDELPTEPFPPETASSTDPGDQEPPTSTEQINWPRAAEVFESLARFLAPLREATTFGGWVDRLLALSHKSRIVPDENTPIFGDDGTLAAAECAGWQTFVGLLEEAKKAEPLAEVPPKPIPLSEFIAQVSEYIEGECQSSSKPAAGFVRILQVDAVRNLEIDHLLVGGLIDSAFPARSSEDGLLGDAQRQSLSERGLPITLREWRSSEEMLLFYTVATRARKTLTLSYAELDDNGVPQYPSPYVNAVLDLFEPGKVKEESRGALDPVLLHPADCISAADLRTVATRNVLDKAGPGLFAAFANKPAHLPVARQIVAAAEMASARFATRGLTAYEGMLHDSRNLERLRQRYARIHQFSVTELEAYASHPFRFFVERVLGLELLETPHAGTDFRLRGNILHSALAELHREEGSVDLIPEEFARRLSELIESHLASRPTYSTWQRALMRIERDLLVKRAALYQQQHEKYLKSFREYWDGGPARILPEVAFGNAPAESGDEGPNLPPIEFGDEETRVRLRGRIDRIDLGFRNGQPVYNIIDYKLSGGDALDPTDFASGQVLQLAVYAIVASHSGLAEGDLTQLGYWILHGTGFRSGLKSGSRKLQCLEPDVRQNLESELNVILPSLVRHLRDGVFPPPPDSDAERYCPEIAAVGRGSQFRDVAESLEKFSGLQLGSFATASSESDEENDS